MPATIARERTMSLARHLHLLRGRAPVRKRLPRPVPPSAIALEYFNAILPVVVSCARIAERHVPELMSLLCAERHERGLHEDSDRDARGRKIVEAAARQAVGELDPVELRRAAEKFAGRAEAHQRRQFDNRLTAAIGVPYSAIEAPAQDRVPGFVERNVDLIRTIPDRYFERVGRDVERALAEGWTPDALSDRLQDAYGASESDAARIARDQIGKLTAQLDQDRQESLGVTQYVWRTSRDQRVRDEHDDREGVVFDWDDPPEDGHPGEPIQCRCWSDPVLDDLIPANE